MEATSIENENPGRTSQTELNLEKINSEEDDYNSSPSEYKITTYPADFTLEILAKKLEDKEIVIPSFQRQFVWKQSQASKLIESFLVGLPVPPIFLYKEVESSKLLLIDGQQRLKSTKYFFEGYFGEEVKGKKIIFRLSGINEKSKWFNKTFDGLDEKDRNDLKNRVLRAFVIQQLDPTDDSSIYHVFERLNTGGTFLNNQEIRNCICFGKFNDLIQSLNNYPDYRKILGKDHPDQRMVDQELILRFFASLDISEYQKPLKDYMTRFMRRNRNPDDKALKKMEDLFCRTSTSVLSSLGPKPFHLKRGLNAATFDCVMAAFAHEIDLDIPLDIKKRYEALIAFLSKNKLNESATTDSEVVKKRFEAAIAILFR